MGDGPYRVVSHQGPGEHGVYSVCRDAKRISTHDLEHDANAEANKLNAEHFNPRYFVHEVTIHFTDRSGGELAYMVISPWRSDLWGSVYYFREEAEKYAKKLNDAREW